MSNRVSRFLFSLAVTAVCALTLPGAVVAQGPFACTGEAYIVQDSAVAGIDGQLTQIDQSVSPFAFVDIGTPQVEYNNIGFNRADGFIYGLALTTTGNNGVHRVGNDGSVTNLGVPTGTCAGGAVSFPTSPGATARFDAGDVNDAGTQLYVNAAGAGRLFIIDITTVPPTVVDCPTISGSTGRVNDWAYNPADGNLYGGDRDDSGQVARIDLAAYAGGATITRTDFNDTGIGFTGTEAFGGAWFDALGDLFLYRNGGAIFQVTDVTGGAPTMQVLDSQLGPASSRNDGAACAQDIIGVGKGMSSAGAGFPDTVTIDYIFENLSASTLDNLSSIDDLVAVFGERGTSGDCMTPTPGTADWFFTSISSAPAAFANPSYNGDPTGDDELINSGQSLTASASATVQVTIMLCNQENATPPNPPGTGGPPYLFFNSVLFTGTNPAGVLFGDVSNAINTGMTPDPDPDMDGSPDERVPAQVPVELQSFSID